MRAGAAVNGQLTFDDCAPDWPEPEPQPQRRPASTRYHVAPQSDLLGQRLHVRRTSRIVTIPISGEYL